MRIGDKVSTNVRYIITKSDAKLSLQQGDRIYFFTDGTIDNMESDQFVPPDENSSVEFEVDREWVNARISEYEDQITFLQEVLAELKAL